MRTTTKCPTRADLFTALFDESGAPRPQWLAAIDRQVYASARKAVPDVVRRVFDVLSERYLLAAPLERRPGQMGAYGYLANRFAWDAPRAIAAELREAGHRVLEHEDGSPIKELATDGEVAIDESELLLAAIERLVRRLGEKEREAFVARMANDFDAKRTYEALRLADPAARNAHNNAWREARLKMARWLAAEGWAA